MALTTTLGRTSSIVNSCEQYVIGYALLLCKRYLSIHKWQSWLVRDLQRARWGCIEETMKLFRRGTWMESGCGQKAWESVWHITTCQWAFNLEEARNNRSNKKIPLKEISQKLISATPFLQQRAHENSPAAGFLSLCVRSSYCHCWMVSLPLSERNMKHPVEPSQRMGHISQSVLDWLYQIVQTVWRQ